MRAWRRPRDWRKLLHRAVARRVPEQPARDRHAALDLGGDRVREQRFVGVAQKMYALLVR